MVLKLPIDKINKLDSNMEGIFIDLGKGNNLSSILMTCLYRNKHKEINSLFRYDIYLIDLYKLNVINTPYGFLSPNALSAITLHNDISTYGLCNGVKDVIRTRLSLRYFNNINSETSYNSYINAFINELGFLSNLEEAIIEKIPTQSDGRTKSVFSITRELIEEQKGWIKEILDRYPFN